MSRSPRSCLTWARAPGTVTAWTAVIRCPIRGRAGSREPAVPGGASGVVDPAFEWTDAGWNGVAPGRQFLYEMHVGTFTRERTWRAATSRLEHLVELGITAVELMPIVEFAGEFGWGYDGVHLFAPYHLYGTPSDVRAFVNRAHELGLAVILDVVYNHL